MSLIKEKLAILLNTSYYSPCEAMLALEQFLRYAKIYGENMSELQTLRAIGNRIYM